MICTNCNTDTVIWRGDLTSPRGVQCVRCEQWDCAAPAESSGQAIEPEEDGACPACGTGTLKYRRVRDCFCHISPPCSACVDAPLVCKDCGEMYERED